MVVLGHGAGVGVEALEVAGPFLLLEGGHEHVPVLGVDSDACVLRGRAAAGSWPG